MIGGGGGDFRRWIVGFVFWKDLKFFVGVVDVFGGCEVFFI